jgi:hypothetical protein
MPYDYQVQREKIFTEKGQIRFLKVRDRVKRLLKESGAFMMQNALADLTGDYWEMMAHVDRLLELGEIKEIEADMFAQNRIFIAGQKEDDQ